MKYPIAASAMLMMMAPAHAAPVPLAPAATPVGVCGTLAADWKRYELNMADREADQIGDNSAPRATLRALEQSNDLALAAMTLQFMRDNRCQLPKRAPSAATYFGAALACSTARLKQSGTETPAECDRDKWTAATPQ